jgi:hypothetical protein
VHKLRHLLLLVLMLCAWAPATASAKAPPAAKITPKMLSAFDDPLVSSTAGLHIASVLLQQAWKGDMSPSARAHAVALASSALSSSKQIVANAQSKPAQKKLHAALGAQGTAIDKAIAATAALPAHPTGPEVRKAATAANLALAQGEIALTKVDPHGIAKSRAAAINAIIGETGLVTIIGETGSKAIIGENGSQAIIGETGSQAIIGETGMVAVNALIGETGLVASTVAKTSGDTKLKAPAQKLSAAGQAVTGALKGAKSAAALKNALGQAAIANRAMMQGLQQL